MMPCYRVAVAILGMVAGRSPHLAFNAYKAVKPKTALAIWNDYAPPISDA